MRITMVGTGYVGLVTGTCFAESGNEVTCCDVDAAKIALLRESRVPFYEPGLEDLIRRNVKEQRLLFSTTLEAAVGKSPVVFIAVGTPQSETTGAADLSAVFDTAEQIGRALKQYTVIVVKSTVPVGTCDEVARRVKAVTQVPFDVVSNPEFLKEGTAIDDFQRPDRIVIGADSDRARAVMEELYNPLTRQQHRVLMMSTRSSELTKYASNAILATRISFINDMAALCERTGADVDEVRLGMGADKRIGYPFLFPGVGFGGSCFPKDVRALRMFAREVGLDLALLEAVDRTNDRQKRTLLDKALKHFNHDLAGKTFGVWGLAFKPKTDDMREAPSITLIEGLLAAGATVRAHDPVAGDVAAKLFKGRVQICAQPYDVAEQADGLFVVTEWNEFRSPDMERLKKALRKPVLFDGRNIYSPAKLRSLGFTYYSVGRP